MEGGSLSLEFRSIEWILNRAEAGGKQAPPPDLPVAELEWLEGAYPF